MGLIALILPVIMTISIQGIGQLSAQIDSYYSQMERLTADAILDRVMGAVTIIERLDGSYWRFRIDGDWDAIKLDKGRLKYRHSRQTITLNRFYEIVSIDIDSGVSDYLEVITRSSTGESKRLIWTPNRD